MSAATHMRPYMCGVMAVPASVSLAADPAAFHPSLEPHHQPAQGSLHGAPRRCWPRRGEVGFSKLVSWAGTDHDLTRAFLVTLGHHCHQHTAHNLIIIIRNLASPHSYSFNGSQGKYLFLEFLTQTFFEEESSTIIVLIIKLIIFEVIREVQLLCKHLQNCIHFSFLASVTIKNISTKTQLNHLVLVTNQLTCNLAPAMCKSYKMAQGKVDNGRCHHTKVGLM